MDEYLFITIAKLKADRLRLERERRAGEPVEESRKPVAEPREQSAPTRWFAREPQWREQS